MGTDKADVAAVAETDAVALADAGPVDKGSVGRRVLDKDGNLAVGHKLVADGGVDLAQALLLGVADQAILPAAKGDLRLGQHHVLKGRVPRPQAAPRHRVVSHRREVVFTSDSDSVGSLGSCRYGGGLKGGLHGQA